jgi:magnesium-transporting ATPase (P-type)
MSKDPAAPGFKQKAAREFKEYLGISAYLAFFFCALTTYTMLLLRKYDVDDYLNYSLAIINALVIGKVILIAQMAHLARSSERRPLYQTVLYKSFIFGIVVFAFHLVEEFIKRVIHGKPFGSVWHETQWEDMIARTIVILCAFIPLFGFMELRRVLGEEKLYLLLRTRGGVEAADSSVASAKAK